MVSIVGEMVLYRIRCYRYLYEIVVSGMENVWNNFQVPKDKINKNG